MHKSAVSLGVDGGDTKGKEFIIEVSPNNPGPTFRMMVSIVGITLAGVVGTCGSW